MREFRFNHSNCHLGENERKRDQMMFEYIYTQHDSFDGNICILSFKYEMNTNGKKNSLIQ